MSRGKDKFQPMTTKFDVLRSYHVPEVICTHISGEASSKFSLKCLPHFSRLCTFDALKRFNYNNAIDVLTELNVVCNLAPRNTFTPFRVGNKDELRRKYINRIDYLFTESLQLPVEMSSPSGAVDYLVSFAGAKYEVPMEIKCPMETLEIDSCLLDWSFTCLCSFIRMNLF